MLVASGTYTPTTVIYIGFDAADSIFVISESGASNTIVDCSVAGFGFYIEGRFERYLLIRGFDIRDASAAAIAINISNYGSITLEDNIIHNSYYGIGIDLSSEIIIKGNLITGAISFGSVAVGLPTIVVYPFPLNT